MPVKSCFGQCAGLCYAMHMVRRKFPLHPKHPERICWGCDRYCPADALFCGNGSGRTEHPAEMLGDDWYTWGDWAREFAEVGESVPDPSQ